ncbi:MAG: hypothetical protein AB1453_03735 [Chloroflexota bacterium]|jgi:rod shape-determining protein MreD
MVATLLALPIFLILLMIQMAVISRLPLLHGTADVLLIFMIAWALNERARDAWQWAIVAGVAVSLVSAAPLFAPLVGYLLAFVIARLLRRQVWQTPILTMLITTFVGTIGYHAITIFALLATGIPVPIQDSLSLVTLPSTLLNLIFALPVYVLVNDLAHWVYPMETVQ